MSSLQRAKEYVASPKLLFRRVKVLGDFKLAAKRALPAISKVVWRKPLDRPQTVQLLRGHEVASVDEETFHLPRRAPVARDEVHPFMDAWDVEYEREYLWHIERNDRIRSMRLTPAGTILVNGRTLLDTDFGSVQGIASSPVVNFKKGRLKRPRVDVDVVIAPWSHSWATYYEYVIHILAKLCWIKQTLDPTIWNAAKIAYPLFEAPFEAQYLSLMGVERDALIDTEEVDVRPGTLIVANLQRQHRLISPAKLSALRTEFVKAPAKEQGRRLYLSREGAKRQVLNEGEVIDLVTKYDLEIIRSIPANVQEQIELFGGASLIVSPHGSGLTNLAWCSPGTQVIELFTRSFMSHLYSYLSLQLGLQHTYLIDDAPEPHHWTHMHKDLTVDINALRGALERAVATSGRT